MNATVHDQSTGQPLGRPGRTSAQIVRNLLVESELSRIVDAFGRHQIDVVVLKGIPLALRLFGTIDSRAMVDNDILVRRRDARSALRVFQELGYRSIDCRSLDAQLDVDYEYRLARNLGAGADVFAELHWNVFPQDLYPVPEETLWSRSEPFDLGALRVLVFDRPLTVVHLAAHFAQSDFAIPSILTDLAQAWNLWYADREPKDVLALARETGLIHVLDFALLSAADLGLLAREPPRIDSRRARRLRRVLPAHRLSIERPTHDYSRKLAAAMLAEPRRVPRWIFGALFPPLENLAAIEGRPVSRTLYLHYGTRPLKTVARLLGRALAKVLGRG